MQRGYDDERLPATRAGLHLVVFACLMLHPWHLANTGIVMYLIQLVLAI